MRELTTEEHKQFNEIFENLGASLDVPESRYDELVSSYQAVGKFLGDESSPLAPYKPEIQPQGSFLLGTMITPVNENDDLDIDLVCELMEKHPDWTAENLKAKVGERLKVSERYKKLLDEEGRRCWTLLYRKNSENASDKYHLDILPCVNNEKTRLREQYFSVSVGQVDKLALRITDRELSNYKYETDSSKWLKSNPFGYAKWFEDRCSVLTRRTVLFSEAKVGNVPAYKEKKSPLQRVVQILKRHRDLMFNGDENKPISIIITTLAARAYNKETDVLDALVNVVNSMERYIEREPNTGLCIVRNPVNPDENFADKWVETPQKRLNFFAWLKQVKQDVEQIIEKRGGLQLIAESMNKPFGRDVVQRTFSAIADNQRKNRDNNVLRATITGALGTVGTVVKAHTFHGDE